MPLLIHRLVILILLSVTLPLVAAETTANDYFEQARQAFKKGDFALAVQEFKKAQQAGMDNAALHYNLGVSYYRLGDYRKAEAAFLRTARFRRMAPVAYYNLGLVKLRQKQNEAAASWFQKTIDTTTDKKLRTLAERMLRNTQTKHAGWDGYIYAGIGYDDNVTLDNDTLTNVSTRADNFLELYGSVHRVLSGSRKQGLLLKANAYASYYYWLNNYNIMEMKGGLYKTLPLDAWSNETGVYATYTTLGGHRYLASANLSVTSKRRLSPAYRLRFRLRLHAIEAMQSRYDYLSGSRLDFRTEGRWYRNNGGSLRAYYQLDINNRNDYRAGTVFSSYSPTRHRLRLDYSFSPLSGWLVRAGGEYRLSRYNDANVDSSGRIIRREDNRKRALLELTHRLNRQADILLEYSYTDNNSTINRYSYRRNMWMGSLQYLF